MGDISVIQSHLKSLGYRFTHYRTHVHMLQFHIAFLIPQNPIFD